MFRLSAQLRRPLLLPVLERTDLSFVLPKLYVLTVNKLLCPLRGCIVAPANEARYSAIRKSPDGLGDDSGSEE